MGSIYLRSSSDCFNSSSIDVAWDTSGALYDSFVICLFEVYTQAIAQPSIMHLSVIWELYLLLVIYILGS